MSPFLTHHLELTSEEYIFVVKFQVPFLSSHPISLLLCPCTCSSLTRSQRGHERLRPVLPTAAGASPSPWLPTGFLFPSHTAPPLPQAFVTVLSTAWPGSDACIPPRPGTQRSSSLFVSFCLWYSIQLSGHAQMLCSWPS